MQLRVDFTAEAEVLFSVFAARHELTYRVLEDQEAAKAGIELLWTFPVQPGLTRAIVLGLQNGDELTFGVDGFWSFFFPFPAVQQEFASILDAWISRRARVVRYRWLGGRTLDLLTEDGWKSVYYANTWPWRGRPVSITMND